MKLKEILATDVRGNLKEISTRNITFIVEMIDSMNNQNEMSTSQFYYNWLKSDCFKYLEKSLIDDYSIEILYGHKTKNLLPSTFKSFHIIDYVQQQWKQVIDFRKNQLLKYDSSIYTDLTLISIAMLVNKYNPRTLYKEHIIFICIKVMTTYFELFNKSGFMVDLSSVARCSDMVLTMDLEELEIIANRLGFKMNKVSWDKIPKTLTLEQILEFISPEDSQTEIKKKIMKWCPCGERKARLLMQKYGLTKQKFTRKSFRKGNGMETKDFLDINAEVSTDDSISKSVGDFSIDMFECDSP